MELKVNKGFLAMTNNGGPLLCYVNEIKNGVAYCDVINGAWEIGFNTQTLEMCHNGTHRYVQPLLSRGYSAKVVLTDLPRGQMGDYDSQIKDALEMLENKKD